MKLITLSAPNANLGFWQAQKVLESYPYPQYVGAHEQAPIADWHLGIGIRIFNDNIDENQTTINHDGLVATPIREA